MGPEPEVDSAADDRTGEQPYPRPLACLGHREKGRDVRNLPEQEIDQAKEKHLFLGKARKTSPSRQNTNPTKRKL